MSRRGSRPDAEGARSRPRSEARLTAETYRQDKLYPRVVRAFNSLLLSRDEVGPEDVLVRMGTLTAPHLAAWRNRRIPYLEKVIASNLSQINRVLQLMRFHAHDLSMRTVLRTTRLRFSKSGHPNAEKNWYRHYQIIGSRDKFLKRTLCVQDPPSGSPGRGERP